MNQALLTSLDKKDDDLRVIENSEYGIVIETSLNVGEMVESDDSKESSDSTAAAPTSVNIQISRHFFAVNALICLMIPLFGIVPFYLLNGLPLLVAFILAAISFITAIILHLALYWHTDQWTMYPTLILTIFNNYILIVALSAAGSTFAPFQGCSILFIECTSAILLGFTFSKTIDPIWCTLVMMSTGLLMWSVGLYAFIREQDWISSGLLFGTCVILYPIMSGYKVYRINRNMYHSGEILKMLCEYPLRGVVEFDSSTSSDSID